MKDKPQMMNQANQMMSMSQQQQQKPSQVMNQRPHLMTISESTQLMLNQPPQSQIQSPQMMMMMMNQPPPPQSQQQQSQMMSQRYGMWQPPHMDQLNFQNPPGSSSFISLQKSMNSLGPRSNWKGKKGIDKRKDGRRKEKAVIAGTSSGGGYKPPNLKELQHQNRLKAWKFYQPKKKFNHNHNNNINNNRWAPFAPRNTTSYIIRAKKSGGIASLVSPCPVTPAVLPTPIFSPSREVLVDMAKEEWGVDGYGSMKGLIRLRSPGNDDEEEEGGSSESDVEEHVEVERRLDHDLSRFEMIYPNYGGEYNNVLENRVDDQDSHIMQLEEENLFLKERVFLMERELGVLRRRLKCLERENHGVEEINEEVVENESENDSESRGEAHSIEENNEEVVEENNEGGGDSEIWNNDGKVEAKEENDDRKVDAKEESKDGNLEAKEENDDGKVDVKDESKDGNLEGKKDNKDGNLEAKDENNDGNFASVNDNRVVKDVCMEEVVHGCSEKSIGDGDISHCPSLIGFKALSLVL